MAEKSGDFCDINDCDLFSASQLVKELYNYGDVGEF